MSLSWWKKTKIVHRRCSVKRMKMLKVYHCWRKKKSSGLFGFVLFAIGVVSFISNWRAFRFQDTLPVLGPRTDSSCAAWNLFSESPYCPTVGFSTPPSFDRCLPKCCSRTSWLKRLVRINLISPVLSRSGIILIIECAVNKTIFITTQKSNILSNLCNKHWFLERIINRLNRYCRLGQVSAEKVQGKLRFFRRLAQKVL